MEKITRNNRIALSVIIIIITALLVFLFWGGDGNNERGPKEQEDSFSFGSPKNNPSDSIGGNDGSSDGETTNTVEEGGVENFKIPKIRKLSFKETSGYGLFDESGTTTIRFIETDTGNIFETSSKSANIDRITNTTILQVIDSYWLNKNDLILQYLDDKNEIRTFSAKIIPAKSDGQKTNSLSGVFFEKNIEQLDGFEGKIFAFVKESNGLKGIVSGADPKTQKVVFSTPLKELLVSWVNKDTVAINTKPSAESLGYLFFLNTSNGSLEKIISEITGLNANVSKNNRGILYNKSEKVGLSLWFIENKNSPAKKISKSTFAEKCAWLNKKNFIVYCAIPTNISLRNLPDDWYKGNVSFSDNIWRINLGTGETELVTELEKSTNEAVDVIKVKISDSDDYLIFVNKKDMTLWSVETLEKD